jgi:hypothetical protein
MEGDRYLEGENTQNQLSSKEDTKSKGTIKNKAGISSLKTLCYVITRRLHFAKDRIGELVTMDDGQEYIVFRQVIVDPKPDQPKMPGAILRITFTFGHGSPKQNILLSLIPIPFIAGLPGFRSKTWVLEKVSGGFQGIYEWDTKQDAEMYKRSFAIKLMTKRAVPGSVVFEIDRP